MVVVVVGVVAATGSGDASVDGASCVEYSLPSGSSWSHPLTTQQSISLDTESRFATLSRSLSLFASLSLSVSISGPYPTIRRVRRAHATWYPTAALTLRRVAVDITVVHCHLDCAGSVNTCSGRGLIEDSTLGLTEVVWVGPETAHVYVGSPSILKIPMPGGDDRWLTSHDFFGVSTLNATVQVTAPPPSCRPWSGRCQLTCEDPSILPQA